MDEVPIWNPERFGIPKQFHESTLDNYEGNQRLIESMKRYPGGGLVLRGVPGSGKTHMAVGLIRFLHDKSWTDHCTENIEAAKADQRPSNYQEFDAQFITAPDLLLKIRASFNNNSNETEEHIVDRFSSCDLLVLDDLGAEHTTEFSLTTLYVLIDRRNSGMKDTIITTNLSQDQIEKKLSPRIASRLASWKNARIDMPDRRKEKKCLL